MKKFSLLLLDANVIIVLCQAGLWGRVLDRCEVLLARTIFEEPFFYYNDLGDKVYFSLEEDLAKGRLQVVEVPVAQVLAFKAQFKALYAGEIHDGEAEALTYLATQKVDHTICSGDKIVFRVMGCLGKGEQGLSLEEILKACGLTIKNLPHEFGEAYRQKWTKVGAAD